MGNQNSLLTKQDLVDYAELTYLTRREILRAFKKFNDLVPEDSRDFSLTETRLTEVEMAGLPELECNPFRDRLVRVFSSHGDDCISFEDFLDMMSVLSEAAPDQLKADYAFRIFDFDDDGYLGEEDLRLLMERLIGGGPRPQQPFDGQSRRISVFQASINQGEVAAENQLQDDEITDIIKQMLEEADLDKSGDISFQEFQHTVTKNPDFARSFTIHLI